LSLQTRLSELITAVGTDIKQLRTWLTGSASGNLTGLTTTAKSDIVSAINELHSQVGTTVVPDASETVKGIAELATLVEVATGTDVLRIVTPQGVKQETDAVRTTAASESVSGMIELASLAEVATGTDAVRAVTPAGVRQERAALKAEILGAGVPAALDTLDELAAALGDDQNFASSVTTSLASKQPLDADLTAIAGLTSAADKIPYSTGAQTWSLATLTAAGRALIDDADAAAQRTTLSVYSQTELGNPDTDLAALYTTAKA
jgi:hypothetical protein